MMTKTLCLDMTERDLDANLLEKAVIYSHGRDVEGKKLLVFDVGKHSKGKKMDETKKIFLYYVERLER